MRIGRIMGVSVAALGLACALAAPARADGPEIGATLGAAMPLSKFKRMVNANVGGTAGFWGGYRFDLGDGFALSLVGNPQFTIYDTQSSCCSNAQHDNETASTVALTAGPKFSFMTDIVETYIETKGGYYRDMSGPIQDDGVGFNAGGGLNFAIAEGSSIGLFARYDYANMVAAKNSDVNRQWVLAGFAFQHVFQPEPPPPPAPPPPPPPPPPPVKRRIVLRGVNFDFDKSNIRPDARPILDEAIATLKAEPNIDVSVEGHTDSIGTEQYNLKLSDRRAISVTDYLVRGGIARSRLTPKGFGEANPVASNETADGRAQNRRVELRIIGQ